MITELLNDDITDIRDLVASWSYDPFAYMRALSDCDMQGYYLEDIRDIRDDGGCVVIVAEKSRILGFAVLSRLPWDSAYFGKKMGSIKYLVAHDGLSCTSEIHETLLKKVVETANKFNMEYLLCQRSTADSAAIHALERGGFLLMDTMLDFTYNYEKTPLDKVTIPSCPEEFTLRLADKNDQGELMDLSKAAFQGHFGRYHADSRVTDEQSTGVYEQWLKSSCEGWADWIIVAQHQNRIAGYSVWKNPSEKEVKYAIELGHYSIGAVGPAYQHRGLFGLLTYEGMKIMEDHCRFLVGPTHVNNYGVQGGYAKLGWKICGGRHSFHKWLSSE